MASSSSRASRSGQNCAPSVCMASAEAGGGAEGPLTVIVARRLARIVTVSEASRAEIERCFGIPEKEIPVVYNGRDLETFRPIPGTPIETDLLFVGRTDDRKKGIGTLLEALTHLPESVKLKIVDGRIGERSLVPGDGARLGEVTLEMYVSQKAAAEPATAGR